MADSSLATSFVIKHGQIDQFGYKITFRKNTNKSSTQTGFTTYVRFFRIYESLFSKFMYVEGTITDGGGMIQRLGVQPGDIMEIDLFKDPSDPIELKISKEFVIEQIGGQDRGDGQKVTRYTFRAVSKIAYENLKNKVKKYFKGSATSIVKGLTQEYLKAEPALVKDENFTQTSGTINYIASSVSPFEAIEQCIKLSQAKEDEYDANFFYYETKDSIKFKSLKDIVSSANAFSYSLQVDKNRDQTSAANDYFRIQEFAHQSSTDQRQKLQAGGLKNKTVGFNFISRKIEETTFDLKQDFKNILVMGPNLFMDEEEIDNYVSDENRFTDEEQCLFVRCSSESYDQPADYIISSNGPRKAQMALMNQTVVSITVHGNPRIRPGDIINLDVSMSSAESKQEKDMMLSGKFLVGSCAHSVGDAEQYVTVCDLFKDGYEKSIQDYRRDMNDHLVKPRA